MLLAKYRHETDDEKKIKEIGRKSMNGTLTSLQDSVDNQRRTLAQDFARSGKAKRAQLVSELKNKQDASSSVVQEVFVGLSEAQKSQAIVQACFKEQIKLWRAEFEKERLAMIPSITCRICKEKFFAD